MSDDNELHRHGRAAYVDDDELREAGFFEKTANSLLIGFFEGRPLYWNGAGGLLLKAGARSGKLRDVLAYNICAGTYSGSMLVLDMKGELAAISRDQTLLRKYCYYWNPLALHGLPQDRINPVDYIRIDSKTLVSDTKVYCQNILPKSGSANAEFFEARGQAFLEAIILTIVRLDGVLTLPRLYEVINLIPGNSAAWLSFAFEMQEAGFPISKSVEEEIAQSRDDTGGGFRGILGEVMKSVAALSDPTLTASVSPPFTASLADMTGTQACHFYLMPPAEFIDSWSPVIKALFVAGMIYKSRAPQAPSQTWILDECAQLGNFPLVTRMFTYGAGIGIRPWAVYQSHDQLRATGPNAETIIPVSAAVQSSFGIREIDTATRLSRQIGYQSLEYDDGLRQAQSDLAYQQAVQSLLAGGDPVQAAISIAHHSDASVHRASQPRELLKPEEALTRPPNRQVIFADGLLHPIDAEKSAYFDQPFMAGRFHPNPFYPPLDRVRVRTRVGHAWLRVIREPVPPEFAHYPQYADGMWNRIEKGKWWQ
ncbi:type IV secretory system conjugative DNA transfer family protein [Novosphingobium sp. CF614]|uniref:type IV secretory system conjugative DNA transfer family protein n=1 Tax=Novosphingobium sp. CF614 TaxID=1884364 RepID=UPI0015A667F5|nr:type IV secretory system conjugative DNA transfer family protein [Novosphingobium sp. CF614]